MLEFKLPLCKNCFVLAMYNNIGFLAATVLNLWITANG